MTTTEYILSGPSPELSLIKNALAARGKLEDYHHQLGEQEKALVENLIRALSPDAPQSTTPPPPPPPAAGAAKAAAPAPAAAAAPPAAVPGPSSQPAMPLSIAVVVDKFAADIAQSKQELANAELTEDRINEWFEHREKSPDDKWRAAMLQAYREQHAKLVAELRDAELCDKELEHKIQECEKRITALLKQKAEEKK